MWAYVASDTAVTSAPVSSLNWIGCPFRRTVSVHRVCEWEFMAPKIDHHQVYNLPSVWKGLYFDKEDHSGQFFGTYNILHLLWGTCQEDVSLSHTEYT